ncbi:MAG: DUF4835 family protein [Bacteroidaceae bacterium]|nr:DUF4835 family protein [Bacteroidaceae bacterium]
MMKVTHYHILKVILLCLTIFNLHQSSYAQELDARVTINHSQIENTRTEVFDALQTKLTEFLNNQKWTDIPFRENEKIQCNFNITVNTYNQEENSFECSLLMNCSRPVYGSSYNTISYAVNDADFTFVFTEFDQLEYQDNQIDNNLIALLAYYAYMIIGMDLDTMAPMGGTDYFHMAEDVATAGENLGFPGWKAFGDSGNRFGLLNDYMDGAMEGMREFNYIYHRKGLDRMSEAPDSARAAIVDALDLLQEANRAKSMTKVAQLFTEYKRDELVNIFTKKATKEEKEKAYEVLFSIDASQSNTWEKIKN